MMVAQVSKTDELCMTNEELCLKNEELCMKNEEFCTKNDGFCSCIQDGRATDFEC